MIAGLTLGGGFGWTSRKFGLTIDNLLSVDIITAEGALRRADATQHPDPVKHQRGRALRIGRRV